MKFTVNGKEFKKAVKIVKSAIDRKSNFLLRINVSIRPDALILSAENFACSVFYKVDAVVSDFMEGTQFSMDPADILSATEMGDSVVGSFPECGIQFESGNVSAKMPIFESSPLRELNFTETCIPVFDCSGVCLKETVNNLAKFTRSPKETGKINMACININTKWKRYESLDGHRMCVKDFTEETIISDSEMEKHEFDMMVRPETIAMLKKCLSKERKTRVSVSEKYFVFSDGVYTIIQSIYTGEKYFNVDSIIRNAKTNWKFEISVPSVASVITNDINSNNSISRIGMGERGAAFINDGEEIYHYYSDDYSGNYLIKGKVGRRIYGNGIVALNPDFVKDICDVMKQQMCDTFIMEGGSKREITMAYNDDRSYTIYTLPMIITEGEEELIRESVIGNTGNVA